MKDSTLCLMESLVMSRSQMNPNHQSTSLMHHPKSRSFCYKSGLRRRKMLKVKTHEVSDPRWQSKDQEIN